MLASSLLQVREAGRKEIVLLLWGEAASRRSPGATIAHQDTWDTDPGLRRENSGHCSQRPPHEGDASIPILQMGSQAQRGYASYPKPHSQKVAGGG